MHPSQQIEGLTADNLPSEGFEYYANGPICGAFHLGPAHDVWFAHYGVKPDGWGRLTEPAKAVLLEFFEDVRAARIIGWTYSDNRAALAFSRRLGFVEDGRFPAGDRELIMQGWTPWQ